MTRNILEWQSTLRRMTREKNLTDVTDFMVMLAVLGVGEADIRVVFEDEIHKSHDLEHFWLEEDCPCLKAHEN